MSVVEHSDKLCGEMDNQRLVKLPESRDCGGLPRGASHLNMRITDFVLTQSVQDDTPIVLAVKVSFRVASRRN